MKRGNLDVSRQELGNNVDRREEVAVEMAQSLPANIPNPQDRPIPEVGPQDAQKAKLVVTSQGEKRRVRESLRLRRLSTLSKVKQWQLEMKVELEQCHVCNDQFEKDKIKVFGDCGHKYCQSCLNEHITYSIKSFKVVNCLEQDCSETLDISSPHIRSLTLPLQQKYYKIRVFLNLSKDEDLRMCPTQNCEGFIKMSEEKVQCAICSIIFCRLCLLSEHRGTCDDNGVLYMQNNYLFKRCSKCKMVLQKNQGCNHMTCKCGYQFCYLCGQKWAQNHKCKAPSPIIVQAPLPPPQPIRLEPIYLPESLPSSSVNRNFPSRAFQSSIEVQLSNINLSLPQSAIPAPDESSTIISCLKYFLIGLLGFLFHMVTAQVLYLFFMCIIVPILVSIFYFFYSFVKGMKNMFQNQEWHRIAIFNIFLYLYYVGSCFIYKWLHFFIHKYCQQIATLPYLFPISYKVIGGLKRCLF